VEIVTIAV